MVMLKTDNSTIDINGKFSGNIYRSDKCLKHMQAFQRMLEREPSEKQKKRRRAFRTCVRFWAKELTWEMVAEWQNYANKRRHTNKKGENISLTWWNMFLKINLIRVYNELDILPYPPE